MRYVAGDFEPIVYAIAVTLNGHEILPWYAYVVLPQVGE